METLTNIPFSLEVESLCAESRVEAGSSDAAEFQSLVELALQIGKPKAAYTVSSVESRDGDAVRIAGTPFTSRTLARNLESVERVFPMVATCGQEMDEAFASEGDLLKGFWWDLIKGRLLGAANRHLSDHLHRKFRLGRRGRSSDERRTHETQDYQWESGAGQGHPSGGRRPAVRR